MGKGWKKFKFRLALLTALSVAYVQCQKASNDIPVQQRTEMIQKISDGKLQDHFKRKEAHVKKIRALLEAGHRQEAMIAYNDALRADNIDYTIIIRQLEHNNQLWEDRKSAKNTEKLMKELNLAKEIDDAINHDLKKLFE